MYVDRGGHMARKRDDTVKLVLRLPLALHRQLKREAMRKDRSLNSEMILRLEASFHWPDLDRAVSELHEAAKIALVGAEQRSPEQLQRAAERLERVVYILRTTSSKIRAWH